MSMFKQGAALLVAAGLVFAAAPALAQKVIKLGHVTTATTHNGAGAAAFAETMAKETNGSVKVEIYPSGQLGGEREMIESIALGVVDMAISTTGPLGNFVPDTNILDIPFLFRDYAHARAVMDSQIGTDIIKKLEPRGIVGLGWGEAGFRYLTNSRRAVATPKDMAGLKIRTMENEIHIRAFRELGALPTPMAFTELFTALQQGTVDGQENPLPTISQAKFPQVQKYLSLTAHAYSPSLIMMSRVTYDKLSAAEKAAAQRAGKAAAAAMRDFIDRSEEKALAELRQAGMQVDKVERAQFEAAMEPVYKQYGARYGADLVKRIRDFK